ncbi:MAG: 3-hydroxyacyl-CoA dehydrogenase/enoyl-CoA hydratase family protein [Deltaproteobacteria bacterium]|nr:MAG: 3-hydroxyacyl-CoA dehydrogenase/enoyl-CoA hydratase family protein [Deltaproteobacteria bacterium]
MSREIKKAVVLGSGVMGSGIAAHLAGAGIPVMLLDIVPKDLKPGESRNKLAEAGIEHVLKSKPSLIFSKRDAKLIKAGNFDDDFDKIKDCDWVIEVVVERLDIKKQVFERVDKVMKPGTIISSNTSGLKLQDMSEGRSAEFKKNFVITHFFNPVRYMKLVELVTCAETDPEVACFISGFLDKKLGKGVVYAKDTPNFVANRIGVFGWFAAMQEVLKGDYKVEEVDKILGSATARPKSAMFRTTDLVGLDTLVHVARNTFETCPNDEKKDVFKIPEIIQKMIDQKLLGDKTGAGFFKKTKNAEGKKEILVLDLKTGEYRAQEKIKYDSLGAAKGIEDSGERLKFMVNQKDRAGELAWRATRDVLIYAVNRIPEITDDIVNLDNAMKWGFNWDLGPFETWDALGVKETADRMKAEGLTVPAFVEKVLTKGSGTFYKNEGGKHSYFDFKTESYQPIPTRPGVVLLKDIKERSKVIKKNDGASLWDAGDGVAVLEFHTKMNSIDADIGQMMNDAVDEVEKNFEGLLVFNEAQNFSVGANIMLVFLEAQQQNWKGLEDMVRGFQAACMRLKYSKKPVVAAPHQMALGGGCEVSLGADAIHAHAELYMGLVEVGVGLIPAGGGCKEMLVRWQDRMAEKFAKIPASNRWAARIDGGPFPKTQQAFEAIAFAKVSMSAKEAIENGHLRKTDRISLSRDHHLTEAKQTVLELAKTYQQPKAREDIWVAGRGGYFALKSAVDGFILQKKISEHDGAIAMKLANIITGGNIANVGYANEQRILDLECEAFLELCGMQKTQERIQYMLMNNKPLRN